MATILADDRSALRAAQRMDESEAVRGFLSSLAVDAPSPEAVKALGRKIIGIAKSGENRETLIDAFMNRYRLSTEEGVVLMCLAEALLRVPDDETANALIRDKIAGRDWIESDAKSGKMLVDMSAWGLSLGSATLLLDSIGSKSTPLSILKRMIRKSGEPVIRQAALAAMKLLGQQFVMGEAIEDAIKRAAKIAPDELCSFDMLGEAARTMEDADRYFEAYRDAIATIGKYAKPGDPHANHGISIKLSALHPRYEYLQADRIRVELLPRVIALVEQARAVNIPIMVDAEESDRLEPHMDMCEGVIAAGLANNWTGYGIVIQAYQKRAPEHVRWLHDLAKRAGVKLAMRLVKGAYWDTEIKRGQVLGLDHFPVFTAKNNTDLCYMRCAQMLKGMTDHLYPCFATHNAMTVAYVASLFGNAGDHELQRLHGMGEGAHDALAKIDHPARPVRIYAPVGTHRDLLAYLVRRLLENGANSSFVHQFSDPDVTVEELTVDPREMAPLSLAGGGIPTGAELFNPERRNSRGYDVNDPGVAAELVAAMDKARATDRLAVPLVGGKAGDGERVAVTNPANGATVGHVVNASEAEVAQAVALAVAAQPDWSLAGGEWRAEKLERAADLLEVNTGNFLALAMDEAGKTLNDAIAELREAADFLRYYAVQARKHFARAAPLPGPTGERNEMVLEGKGVFACISPWNFPLAIFLGQVSAALVAGNAVLAKPAEQTPLIAFEAVKLLHEAGIPPEVLAFLPGDGDTVGVALTNHPQVDGVCFTGSTQVAQIINRSLAARDGAIPTLIAETGGLNAMIVDSTALPEQVARDVTASAFQSAGQRCSALRMLVVQEDVADTMVEIVRGAMAEMRVGDPALLTSDVGPIIDAEARDSIRDYIEDRRRENRVLAEAQRTSDAPEGGTFIAPTMIRLDRIADMKREIFGPVLHVVTFRADEMDTVIDQINATGYGLTLGIHSRIDAVAAHIASRARAGNIYINRNQIGAIVGSQPFGGRGLSGTGPKAGGPHYLFRFAEEKTMSTDITASGGNTALMTR